MKYSKKQGFYDKKTDPFKYSLDRLEDVADQISDVLNCPITIEDTHHRLLAYSTHNDFTDPARTSTIISRRVPEKSLIGFGKTVSFLHSLKQMNRFAYLKLQKSVYPAGLPFPYGKTKRCSALSGRLNPRSLFQMKKWTFSRWQHMP